MESPATSAYSPRRVGLGEASPPTMGTLDGATTHQAEPWQALMIGRSTEEVRSFAAQLSLLLKGKGVNVEPATYHVVEQRGLDRVSIARWTAATIAAIRKAGITTTSFNPITGCDSDPRSTPVKGEVTESDAQPSTRMQCLIGNEIGVVPGGKGGRQRATPPRPPIQRRA